MTTKEIVERENGETDRVFLYREGIFWKLYERSAWWFVQNVHPFKPAKRFVKSVGQEVVTIGFPVTAFDKYAAALEVISKEEKIMMLGIPEQQRGNKGFGAWKDALPPAPEPERKKKAAQSQAYDPTMVDEIIHTIRRFDIENRTPLECMHCMTEIKQMANQI